MGAFKQGLKSAVRSAISAVGKPLRRLAPLKVRRFLAESWSYSDRFGSSFSCPVCATGVAYFEPVYPYYLENWSRYGYIHSVFTSETFNIHHYLCPICKASDRDRLYALYLKSRLGEVKSEKLRFVDFAPAVALSRFIRALPSLDYRSADLFDPRADDKIDLMDINYPSQSVDAFLCSHILEHVEDDKQAMRELRRILRPGGFGIAMVPLILAIEETLEDPAHISEADRWKHYGQNDHVRIYAKADFVRRLQGAGFSVSQLGIEHFGSSLFERNGIHPRSVLYVVELLSVN